MADSKAEYPAPDCLAPAAIEAKTETAGVTKAILPVAKAFLLAMFAGAFIAFGGLFFTVFLSDSTLGWGAQRVVGGLCFCLGLVLVLVCGAELFTGNSLMVCALKSKKITLVQMLKAWVVVWVGNFVGALFIVFLVYMAGIYKLNGEAVANSKVSARRRQFRETGPRRQGDDRLGDDLLPRHPVQHLCVPGRVDRYRRQDCGR